MTAETAEKAEVVYGGTFTFPSLCRPWRACSQDETRPAMCHPYLHRRDDGLWLCATDSYIAVAIKVNEGPDTPVQEGYVHRAVTKHIRRGREATQLSATAWTVVVGPTHEATYDLAGRVGSEPFYPQLESSGLWDGPKGGQPFGDDIVLGFNPDLTQHVHAALGGRGLEAQFRGPLTAIQYRAQYIDGVGLQMPVRIADAR